MKRYLKAVLNRCGFHIHRGKPDPLKEVVSLRPSTHGGGNALLALWIKPFLRARGMPLSMRHPHYATSVRIAQAFLDFGYNVDVIDFLNAGFHPRKPYDCFVSFRTNLERIAPRLPPACIKIAHMDTAHWLFNNSASLQRGLALQRRRGVTLQGLRIIERNMALEVADYVTFSGNRFTQDTYAYADKPLFRTHQPTCGTCRWNSHKDFDGARNNFVWFGSSALVHKGLDLVLEAFVKMPDHHLYICGPIAEEKDFERAYQTELYRTPNIHTLGWVDVNGPLFQDVMSRCVALVYASCSEGGGSSVLQCMQAGVIPIVSYESSVDVDGFGVLLPASSTEAIMEAVHAISSLPASELEERSQAAWQFARAHHTFDQFTEDYEKVLTAILAERGLGKPGSNSAK